MVDKVVDFFIVDFNMVMRLDLLLVDECVSCQIGIQLRLPRIKNK